MRLPVVAYFDTNIVRDLAEERPPGAKDKANKLKALVAQGKVVIAPSFEVLYELISAPDACDTTHIENAQFYDVLVSWRHTLKPSNQMLKDDIFSCLHQGGPSTPFQGIDENRSGFIQSIRAGQTVLLPKAWEKVVRRSQLQNKRFVGKVFNSFVNILAPKSKTDLRKHPNETWRKWWSHGEMVEIIANSLAGDQHVKTRCSFLSLPSVRAGVGFILHMWYQQIVSGAQLKPTEHYDFRNAVLGGGVGNIVTHDRKLRNAINHIPNLNVKTWTLEQFIAEVK